MAITFTGILPSSLKKTHADALRVILARACRASHAASHEIDYTVDVTATDYGTLWVRIDADITSLPQNNCLRLVTLVDGHWFVSIGKRGKVCASSYPQSFKQFAGGTAFGMHVEK